MKFRIVENAWWMFWADGMVLYPWVWLKAKPKDHDIVLLAHEVVHCRQIKRMGVLKFYASYLWLLLRHGYQKHPYEIEARQNLIVNKQLKVWYEEGRIVL